MSAVQAAIRRRATINPSSNQVSAPSSNQNVPPTQSGGQQNVSGLTIQQVVQVIDTRLLNLEAFMKEVKSTPTQQTKDMAQTMTQETPLVDSDITLNTIIDEYNHRFELIADEISHMKEIIIKLQTFTMEVNKKILDNYLELVSNNMFSMTTSAPSPCAPEISVSPENLATTDIDNIESKESKEIDSVVTFDTIIETEEGEPEFMSNEEIGGIIQKEEEEIKPIFKKGSNKSGKSNKYN